MDRGEWETPVDGELDLSAAAGTPLESLVADEAMRESLKPVFTVDTDGKAFEAEFDGALIEVALDRAKASGRQQDGRLLGGRAGTAGRAALPPSSPSPAA